MNRFGDSVQRQDRGEPDLRENIVAIHVKILEATDLFEEQIDGISRKFDDLFRNVSDRLTVLEEKLTDIKLRARLDTILEQKNITPSKFAESQDAQVILRKTVTDTLEAGNFVDDTKLNNGIQQALIDITPKKFAESADAKAILQNYIAQVIDTRALINKTSFDAKVDDIDKKIKTLSNKIAGRRQGRRLRNLRAESRQSRRKRSKSE